MNYFDLNILYQTYIKIFYKYSIFEGKEITTCQKPSFLPQFTHLKPYFSRSEIINLSLNLNIISKKEEFNNINELCDKIQSNDINFDMLLKHKKYMGDKKSVGLIQYYTLQGSYIMNEYLRNLTNYKDKNDYLESLISPVWDLITSSPKFDKDYTLYRFIQNDKFLSHLKIDDIYTEKGFLSTTRDPFYKNESFDFGFILLKIKIPKNIKGVALCLETISHFPSEQEIIFPPLSKFKLVQKNNDCIYYHTDNSINTKIKTKYEFEYVGRDDKKFDREKNNTKIQTIDFLKEHKQIDLKIMEKIKQFEKDHINEHKLFNVKIGEKTFTIISEWYDSIGAYEKYYAIKTKNGFSMYCIYDNYVMFFIEIFNDEMNVNYYVKYSELDVNQIVGDENLILFYSSVAYYFNIHTVNIYASYKNCEKNKLFGGSYCIDFFDYIVKNKKKYLDIDILNSELRPNFSYFNLDLLKAFPVSKIISKDDNELYQVYKNIYLVSKNKDNIIDFYIWLINFKCFLLNSFINSIDKIMKDNNPFKNDKYILNAITFLYNRKYINLYSDV